MTYAYQTKSDPYSTSNGYEVFRLSEMPSTSPGAITYVVAASPKADLFTEYEALDELGWDGYDAEPILIETVSAARRFRDSWPRSVAPPDIAPGPDGTIGFEWRLGKGENRTTIQVEVGPGDIIRGCRERSGRVEHWPARALNIGTYLLISNLFPSVDESA